MGTVWWRVVTFQAPRWANDVMVCVHVLCILVWAIAATIIWVPRTGDTPEWDARQIREAWCVGLVTVAFWLVSVAAIAEDVAELGRFPTREAKRRYEQRRARAARDWVERVEVTRQSRFHTMRRAEQVRARAARAEVRRHTRSGAR